jgi:hypothetical protein
MLTSRPTSKFHILDIAFGKYAIASVALFSIFAWIAPFDLIATLSTNNHESISTLFPNLTRVLGVPFENPKKISATLLFVHTFFTLWMILVLFTSPSYVNFNKFDHLSKKDFLKSFAYALIMVPTSVFGAVYFNGRTTFLGNIFIDNDLLYIATITTMWWWASACYLVIIGFIMRVMRKDGFRM